MAVDLGTRRGASILERRPGLTRFALTGIRNTGTLIDRGFHLNVVELEYHGLKCAGKSLYSGYYESAMAPGYLLERLETECAILSDVKHPNIVQFLGLYFESASALPLLVMEYIPKSLSDCLRRYGKLPEEVSYGILDDVATALCYLHSQDPPLVHRDLAARKILLTADMRAKVTDLSVMKIRNVNPGRSLASASIYVPPPSHIPLATIMAKDPVYDTKVDSFSYGALALHVLCGTDPAPKRSFRFGLHFHEVDCRETYFQYIDPSHPLRPLINQCLSNDPPDRPNAVEILHQLRGVLAKHHPGMRTEDRVALLSEYREKNESLQEELRSLQAENHRLSSREREIERLQAQLSDFTARNEELASQLEAASEEVEAAVEISVAKDREIAAKDSIIATIRAGPRAQTTDNSASDGGLDSRPGSSRKELQAITEVSTAKDCQIVAKDCIIAAARKDLSAKDISLKAKDKTIQMLLRHTEKMTEHIPSAMQPHLLTPDAKLSWTQGAHMPVAMTAAQCVVIDGVIYAGGGNTRGDTAKYQLGKYQSAHDRWSTLDCPVKFFGLGRLEGRLVLVGGTKKDGTVVGDVNMLEEETQTWDNSTLPPMPTARIRLTVISCSFGIAACGGRTGQECSNVVEVYATETRQWQPAVSLPNPLMVMRSVVIGPSCYLLGGCRPTAGLGNAQADCFRINLKSLFCTAEHPLGWEALPSAPLHAAPANLGGALVSIGGSTQLHAFSNTLRSWVHIGDLPCELKSSSCAMVEEKIFVLGGWSADGQRRDSMFIGSLK